jgi:LPXTG-motif cell wall-anchored protein
MWVLITFLVLLTQVGDKKKMILLAGLFIVAEAIMYNLILNVWFTTWDFVGLDAIVTPLVGLLALGGGGFFLYRYRKNRNKPLVCDVSDLDTQASTMGKIQDLITKPTTILTILGIIGIAFSVNIIEFACSIGVPQAYTKILEINNLDFITRQFYILIYTLGYMVDDVVVFGLAIWGFSKLEANGHKYAQMSLLIGGVLMLVLGAILVLNPSLLVL